MSLKRPSHLVLNLYGYVFWISYTAWVSSYKFAKHQSQEGHLSKKKLFFAALKRALFYGLPPRCYIQHEMYLPKNNKKRFHYFFNVQLPYFHDATNRHFINYKKAKQLMADKHQFALALYELGLPSVLGEVYSTQHLKSNLNFFYQEKSIFCKPNHGSQSLDAFLLRYDAKRKSYCLSPVKTPDIEDKQAIDEYLKGVLFRHHTLLIQPFIEDHQEVKVFSKQKPSTTVRIITHKRSEQADDVELLYLQLEVPKEKGTLQFYQLFPLCVNTLDVDAVFKEKQRAKPKGLKQFPQISVALKQMLKQAIELCRAAHKALLPVNTVSFDVILSTDGPVILEANYNWSVELLYHVIDCPTLSSHPAALWLIELQK